MIGSWKCYTGGDLREEIQGRIQAGDLKEHTLGNSGIDTNGRCRGVFNFFFFNLSRNDLKKDKRKGDMVEGM